MKRLIATLVVVVFAAWVMVMAAVILLPLLSPDQAQGQARMGRTASVVETSYVLDDGVKRRVQHFSVVGTTNGDNTLIAAVEGRKFRILSFGFWATSATARGVYLHNGDNDVFGDATNRLPIAIDADGDVHGSGVFTGFIGGLGETDTNNEAFVVNQDGTTPIIYVGSYVEITGE